MKNLLVLLFLLINIVVQAQVHVKGYYRKDGTYVKPHVRSNPDGNPYNNYSYPGNTNPYTGKVAPGNANTYLNNYNNNNSNSSINQSNYGLSNPTYPEASSLRYTSVEDSWENVKYVTSDVLNIRSSPSTNSKIITSKGYGDKVRVIKTINSKWTKVEVLYFDNYNFSLDKTIIGYAYSTYLNTESITDQIVKNSGIDYSGIVSDVLDRFNAQNLENKAYSGKYKFNSLLNTDYPNPMLLEEPFAYSKTIYNVPRNAVVYVIDNTGEVFYKVFVNGNIGYISKYYLLNN